MASKSGDSTAFCEYKKPSIFSPVRNLKTCRFNKGSRLFFGGRECKGEVIFSRTRAPSEALISARDLLDARASAETRDAAKALSAARGCGESSR